MGGDLWCHHRQRPWSWSQAHCRKVGEGTADFHPQESCYRRKKKCTPRLYQFFCCLTSRKDSFWWGLGRPGDVLVLRSLHTWISFLRGCLLSSTCSDCFWTVKAGMWRDKDLPNLANGAFKLRSWRIFQMKWSSLAMTVSFSLLRTVMVPAAFLGGTSH